MNFIYIESIESTQSYLKAHCDDLPDHTWLCTGYQTHGKGQFDRVWESEANVNILCSLLLKDIDKKRIHNIQLKVSKFIMDMLKNYDIKTTFKAPNDIFVGDKKLCGILVDTKIKEYTFDAIIGIGLNVNQTRFPSHLNATSMSLLKGVQFALDDIKENLKKLPSHIKI